MFMVNYSTKNSQCQEKIKNIMSCCIDLHYLHTVNSANQCNLTYLYRYDLRINMSRYWSGGLSWLFRLCIFFNYVNQTTKISLSKIIIRFEVPDFQNKRQIFYHQGSCFFLLQQGVVLTLNLWWQVVEKGKQPNLQQKPATCFKCKWTFVTTQHESVKRRNKAFQGKKIL